MQLEKDISAISREAEGLVKPEQEDESNGSDEAEPDDEEDVYDIGDADVSTISPTSCIN